MHWWYCLQQVRLRKQLPSYRIAFDLPESRIRVENWLLKEDLARVFLEALQLFGASEARLGVRQLRPAEDQQDGGQDDEAAIPDGVVTGRALDIGGRRADLTPT